MFQKLHKNKKICSVNFAKKTILRSFNQMQIQIVTKETFCLFYRNASWEGC